MNSIRAHADLLNGWLCFTISILWIGILTAIIGDLASHLGCTIGLRDSFTAIALVAVGTSVPGKYPYTCWLPTGKTGREKVAPLCRQRSRFQTNFDGLHLGLTHFSISFALEQVRSICFCLQLDREFGSLGSSKRPSDATCIRSSSTNSLSEPWSLIQLLFPQIRSSSISPPSPSQRRLILGRHFLTEHGQDGF